MPLRLCFTSSPVSFYSTVLLFFLMVICCISCKGDEKINAARIAENYKFPPSGALEDRIYEAPDILIEFLSVFDKDYIKPGFEYKAYTPDEAELNEIKTVIKNLPAEYTKRITPKLLGIYFVKNLLGSGFAEFVKDKKGRMYYILMINPKVLKIKASSWITDKEKSCFTFNEPGYDLEIDIGPELSGFFYIFNHEISHIYDYIAGMTPGEPFLDTAMLYVTKNKEGKLKKGKYEFIRDEWLEYEKPAALYDFKNRDKITYYGMSGGPKISISDAPAMYDELQKTPFVSLYGSLSWMEDYAEFMAAYINVKKLGRPWTLRIKKDGNVIYEMKNDFSRANLKKRISIVDGILSSNGD